MSGTTENSLLQKVKYKNFKNEIDEQTAEILISSISEENKSSGKIRGRIDNSNLKLMTVFITIIIFIILVISYILYSKILPIETHSGANNYEGNSVHTGIHTILQNSEEVNFTKAQELSSEMSNENNTMKITLPEFGTGSHSPNTCVPLKYVEKVILMNERAHTLNDYSCSDNATCQMLLQKIEQDQNGSSYNFVIGTGGELYVGLGFTCLINSSESALYIKFIQQSSALHDKQCLRVNEVINQGVSCGFISENFTLLHKESDSEFVIDGSLVYYQCLLNHESEQNRSLHFHDPNHEINTLIHGDVKWTVCGNFSHTTEVRKSRVITLESLQKSSCLPLNLVNEIFIDVIETQPFSCSDNLSCIQTFEEQHDGFKFNFIVGPENDVYVGLGFKCRAENSTGNVLKIKVLEKADMSYGYFYSFKIRKILQILEEGIVCGKVDEYYFSVKVNCDVSFERTPNFCKLHHTWSNSKKDLDKDLQSIFHDIHNEDYYNITSEHGRGVVPVKFRFSACNRRHLRTDHTTVTPEAHTDIPLTTPTPYSYYDEYDYSSLNLNENLY